MLGIGHSKMTHDQAVALMRTGVLEITGVWADLGCGHGTFSRALSELLGPLGTVIAIDHDDAKLQRVGPPPPHGAPIYPLDADFCYPLKLPPLDGFLLANSLHFVARQQKVLGQLATLLKPGGTALFLEYDTNIRSPWDPHPLPPAKLERLCGSAGLDAFAEIARFPSVFGSRELYLALAKR